MTTQTTTADTRDDLDDLDDLDHHGLTEPADERMVLRGRCPMNATIYERGNGFADVGDYVTSEGNLYRVVSITGHIQTGTPGTGTPNYMAAEVEEADWDDLTDEQADAIICTCTVAGIPTEPAPGEGQ